jgi:hypothetical protein
MKENRLIVNRPSFALQGNRMQPALQFLQFSGSASLSESLSIPCFDPDPDSDSDPEK